MQKAAHVDELRWGRLFRSAQLREKDAGKGGGGRAGFIEVSCACQLRSFSAVPYSPLGKDPESHMISESRNLGMSKEANTKLVDRSSFAV